MDKLHMTALIPYIVLSAASATVMLTIAWRRNHRLTVVLTLVGLAAAMLTLPPADRLSPESVTSLILIDRFSLSVTGLFCAAAFIVAVLAHGYFEQQSGHSEEFYVLLLLATLGACVLPASTHFASLFLSLELLSVSLYALTAYLRHSNKSIEAGVKYLILAAVSSAFILLGMAFLYFATGNMAISVIASRSGADSSLLSSAGTVLIIVGLGFKLAVVPFHLWTPDVYEGAPAPVSAFIATVSKGAVFALVLRALARSDFESGQDLPVIISIISIASMVAGNLLALLQRNVKRILAYSSISHLGYLLVALQAGGPLGVTASLFYLTAYVVTMLGAFGVVTLLSGRDRDAESISDFRGMAWKRPWTAAVFTGMLLSLAGIPLTGGFIGKFYLAAAAVNSALWLQAIVLVITSAIGLFYYLRIIVAVYSTPTAVEGERPLARAGSAALAALTAALVWLGIYPGPLLAFIKSVAGSIV
jgi:NADH-quinone oxidoreductase subunit N